MPFPSTQYSVNYIVLTLDNTDNTLTTSNSLDNSALSVSIFPPLESDTAKKHTEFHDSI